MYASQQIVNLAVCLLAFALIFWGLKLFKLYIILIGIALGGMFGAFLGGEIGQSQAGIFIGAFITAIIGGVIAWPLQKIFVFIISGVLVGFLGVAIATALGAPDMAAAITGLIFFLFGGIMAVLLYDYFIIIVTAYGGAQIIFNLVYAPGFIFPRRNAEQVMQRFVRLYSEHIVAFLVVIILFVLFALVFQKWDDKAAYLKNQKHVFRKASYLFALIALAGYGLSLFYGLHFSGTVIFGVSLMSWPLVAALTTLCVSRLNKRGHRHLFLRLIALTFLGLTLVPLTSWCLASFISFNFSPFPFYHFFINGSSTMVIAKWIYSLVVFPALAYVALLKSRAG